MVNWSFSSSCLHIFPINIFEFVPRLIRDTKKGWTEGTEKYTLEVVKTRMKCTAGISK